MSKLIFVALPSAVTLKLTEPMLLPAFMPSAVNSATLIMYCFLDPSHVLKKGVAASVDVVGEVPVTEPEVEDIEPEAVSICMAEAHTAGAAGVTTGAVGGVLIKIDVLNVLFAGSSSPVWVVVNTKLYVPPLLKLNVGVKVTFAVAPGAIMPELAVPDKLPVPAPVMVADTVTGFRLRSRGKIVWFLMVA